MSYTIIRSKNRAEWLNHRSGGIGSSEVGTIMGLNPWETPYQLWRRKMGIDPAKEENFAMRAGHYLEDAVSLFYQDETQREIIKSSKGDWLMINDDKPHLRVSPDRTFWLNPEGKRNASNKGILECKTTQMEIDPNSIPQHWFSQLQYQLGVAELEYGALAWLTMGRTFDYKDFEFDSEFYKYEIECIDEFWNVNILGKQEPLPINVDDILLKNPRHIVGKVIEADEDLVASCANLKIVKEELKSLETQKKELESAIKMALGDAEALISSVVNHAKPTILATWKAAKDSISFNEKMFKAENPEMYAKYMLQTAGSRRFLIK